MKIIIHEDEKIIKITEEKKEQKKRYIELFLVGTAIYALMKITANHEMEITKLKKVIEEMKSKGE